MIAALGTPFQVTFLLPDALRKELWDQGVCVDDYDFFVFAPPEILVPWEPSTEGEPPPGGTLPAYVPKDFRHDLMLRARSDRKWYKATIDGQEYAVGVAYH